MSLFSEAKKPLADRVRPKTIDEIIGQEHILGKGQFLRTAIERGEPVSMILWGPPGTGKTTLARIVAGKSKAAFREISAVTTGIPDVKKIIAEAKQRFEMGESTILFVDEIHRFNKAQQDAFLPHMEDGTIILIGATTENPSFEVINPLLSRARVVTLNALEDAHIEQLIKRAVKEFPGVKIQSKAVKLLAHLSAGDARVALNGIEAATQIGAKTITSEVVKQAMQKLTLTYDKQEDDHYNTISAFIKSMRGSDVDASLYYLHRMLEGGEDPKFIARRIVIFASEDIGVANPGALNLAVSTFQAVERIGLPEAKYALTEAAIVMAESNKSRAVADAMGRAQQAVRQHPRAQVPLHVRNAPTDLMKELGYGKDYKWKADFKHKEGFLPDEIKDIKLYNSDT